MIDAIATDLSFLPLKFSRNRLAHTIEGADPLLVSRANLKYFLTISVPEYPFSTNFEELHTSEGREKPVSSENGVSVFSGAEFRFNNGRNGKIDGLLTYQKPRQKQADISVSLTQTTAYSLTEKITGGAPAVNVNNALAKQYAIKAGINNEDFYAYSENFWNTYQAGKRQFLTWAPDYKTVSRKQEEYLSFLINFTPKPETLRLRMQYYTAAGVISEPVTALSVANPQLYSVITCPVSPERIAVPAAAVRYEVWLSNEKNKRVSETRTYEIDDKYTYQERQVMFVNSLGGWDTLRLIGEGQRSLKVAQTVAAIERPADAGVDFSELRIINIEGENELQVSTGFFHRNAAENLKYLNELLLSEQMYLITPKGHRALQLTTSTLVDEQDNADLIARSFTFRILDTVENYSNLPAAEPVPLRATVWRGVGLRHILDGVGKRTGKLAFSRLEKVYADNYAAVKPYTIKVNVQGDPDYLAPIQDNSIPAGSTPFPSAEISRITSFKRTNCGANYLGGTATILIAAGKYGGEAAGDANALAESEFAMLNTQAYANTYGSCTINNTPVRFGIFHKIPMTNDYIAGSSDFGPVVDLRVNGNEIVQNTTGSNPAIIRYAEGTFPTGVYTFVMEVQYANSPRRPCKLQIPSKNREVVVTTDGFYVFENVTVNSSDDPLTINVVPL